MINQVTKRLFLQYGKIPLLMIPKQYNSSDRPSENTQKIYQTQKTKHVIQKNVGMNRFMNRVYNTSLIGLSAALGTSYVAMNTPFFMAHLGGCAIAGIISTLVGFISTTYMKPTSYTELVDGVEVFKTQNTPLRLGLFGLGCFGLGLSATPLFMMATAISPSILTTSIALTSAIFGGASLWAYSMPKDKMLGYGGILMGSLFGLIGMQIIGLLTSLVMGPNPLSLLLFKADTYLGVGLFSIFIAYDTHMAIKMYENRQADHIGIAAQFILDFWNILVRIVSIMINKE